MCAAYLKSEPLVASSPQKSAVGDDDLSPNFGNLSAIESVSITSLESCYATDDLLICSGFEHFHKLELDNVEERAKFDDTIGQEWKEKYPENKYDANGMNLLHYCIWNCHCSTVKKLATSGYDIGCSMSDLITNKPLTPMQLIICKFKKDMKKGFKKNLADLNNMAKVLIKANAEKIEIHNLELKIAIHLPIILVHILKQCPEVIKILPKQVKNYFNEKFVNMGFFDLMLEKNCSYVILCMIKCPECHKFLKEYKDSRGQTALHSAAKYFEPSIVKQLMCPSINSRCTIDKNGYTPITTVLNQIDILYALKDDDFDDKESAAINVVATILKQLPENERMPAVYHDYHGIAAIVHEMQWSGRELIVQGILSLDTDECVKLLFENNGKIFHTAAKFGYTLEIFEDKIKDYVNDDDFQRIFKTIAPSDTAVEHGQPIADEQSRTPFDTAVKHGQLQFLEEACNSDMWRGKKWLQEIKTACKIGNLEALKVFHCHRQESFQGKYEELLRLACEYDHPNIVLFLSREKIKVDNKDCSALMLAVDSDAMDCIGKILDSCKSLQYKIDRDTIDHMEKIQDCEKKLPNRNQGNEVDGGSSTTDRTKKLLDECKNLNCVQDEAESNPTDGVLNIATILHECKDLRYKTDSDTVTIECIENFCKNLQAKRELHALSVETEDADYDNILCRAIRKGKKKAVMTILTHDNGETGKKALKFCHKETNTTPLRLLVKHMPDIAIWVLNNQITKDPNGRQIKYNYDLIDDLCEPKQYCTKCIGCHKSAEEAQDQCVKHQNPEYEPTNHLLYILVENNSLGILRHRLVENVIDHYWKYAWNYWIVLRIFYLLCTLLLTMFTLNLPHPKHNICTGNVTIDIGDSHHQFLLSSSVFLVLFSVITLVISTVTLYSIGLKQIFLLLLTFGRYRVLFEMLLALCILLFVIGYYIKDDWCAENYQWNFGAICTCLSWMTVIISLKGFPPIASHINKLFTIIYQFLTIIFLPILFIIAFFLPYSMLFAEPWREDIFGPFHNTDSVNTLNILLIGVTGGYRGPLDVEDFKDFPIASYLIFLGFVIVVTVLFNNLLISLAVGEPTDLQNKADLNQYRLKVEFIIDILDLFYPYIQKKKPDLIDKHYRKDFLTVEKKKWKKAEMKKWKEAEMKWKKAEKKWREAEYELEKAVAYNKDLEDKILKGTDEEILRNKIAVLEIELEKISKKVMGKEIKKNIEAMNRDIKEIKEMSFKASFVESPEVDDEILITED